MIGCDWIGVHYLLSSAVCFTTVVMWSYPLHARFTFYSAPISNIISELRIGDGNESHLIVLMFLFPRSRSIVVSVTFEYSHFVGMEFRSEPLGHCRQAYAAERH